MAVAPAPAMLSRTRSSPSSRTSAGVSTTPSWRRPVSGPWQAITERRRSIDPNHRHLIAPVEQPPDAALPGKYLDVGGDRLAGYQGQRRAQPPEECGAAGR